MVELSLVVIGLTLAQIVAEPHAVHTPILILANFRYVTTVNSAETNVTMGIVPSTVVSMPERPRSREDITKAFKPSLTTHPHCESRLPDELGSIPLDIREFAHRIIIPTIFVVVHVEDHSRQKLNDLLGLFIR